MKKQSAIITLILLSVAYLGLLSACVSTTDSTGKKTTTLTPAAKADLQTAGSVLAQAIAGAAVTGAENAASQYFSTGKINTKALASAEVYGLASNAQGYVGQLVSKSTLVSAIGTPSVAASVSAALPSQVSVTQELVNSLQAQAASPNVSGPVNVKL